MSKYGDTLETAVTFVPGRDSIPGLREKSIDTVMNHIKAAGLPDTREDVENHITFAGIEESSFSKQVRIYKARYTVRNKS